VEDCHYLHRIKVRPCASNVNLLPDGHFLVVLRDNQQVLVMALGDQERKSGPLPATIAADQGEAFQPRVRLYRDLGFAVRL
jgi:hypothetical protein